MRELGEAREEQIDIIRTGHMIPCKA